MDEFDRELHDRLEALSDSVPLASSGSNGQDVRMVAGHRWQIASASQPEPGSRGTPRGPGLNKGLGVALVLVVLMAASIASLLFLGGQISGILNTVGAPIAEPSPDSWIRPEQVGHVIDPTVLHLHEPASPEPVGILVLSGSPR
jgi:hypothetical protein